MEYTTTNDPYRYMFSRIEDGKVITSDIGGPLQPNDDGTYTLNSQKFINANSFMQPKSLTENETYDIDYYDSANARKTIRLRYSGITPEGRYEFKFAINPLKIENIYLVDKKMGGKKYTKRIKKINKKSKTNRLFK